MIESYSNAAISSKRQSVKRFIRTQMAHRSPRPRPLRQRTCSVRWAIIAKSSARKMRLGAGTQKSLAVSASAIVCLIGHCRVISVSPAFSLWLHPAALRTNARTVDLHASIKFDTPLSECERAKCGVCYCWEKQSLSASSASIECVPRLCNCWLYSRSSAGGLEMSALN